MKNNLHVFLGATVADAAARPLHWVYNQKKLLTYIKGKKDFTFLKKNKSPFYNIKTGKVSGYNEVGQVMFKTLIEDNEEIGALLLTHYNVNNSDISEISDLCKQNKVVLIEDCAISIASKCNNKFVGKFGDYSIFSFGFYKFVNVLSGGMILSKNKNFYDFVVKQEETWPEIKLYNIYKLIIKSFLIRIICSKIIFNLIFPIIKFSYKKDIKFITKFFINDPKPHLKKKFPENYKFKLSRIQIDDVIFQLKNLEKNRKLREQNYMTFSKNIKND